MIRSFILGLAALLPGAAMAQGTCPTAADLDEGVRVTRFEPFFSSVFTRQGDSLHEARVMDRDGLPEEVSTVYAHPLAVQRTLRGDGRTFEFVFTEDTGLIDNLPQTGRWTSAVQLLAGQSELGRGTFALTFDGFGSETIGGCTYETWEVTSALDMPAVVNSLWVYEYAPALGLVLLAQRMEGDRIAPAVVFDEIAAE